MSYVKEYSEEKMDAVFEKEQMTSDSFKQKRFDLYKAQNWPEYETLLKWELVERERVLDESLTAVCKALDVKRHILQLSGAANG